MRGGAALSPVTPCRSSRDLAAFTWGAVRCWLVSLDDEWAIHGPIRRKDPRLPVLYPKAANAVDQIVALHIGQGRQADLPDGPPDEVGPTRTSLNGQPIWAWTPIRNAGAVAAEGTGFGRRVYHLSQRFAPQVRRAIVTELGETL
jgi:hypothetical protein